jgi:outer membrane protein assembly factor BamB
MFTAARLGFSDTFARDGIVYVGTREPHAISRLDLFGNVLTPFTTNIVNVGYLAPGPGGGLLAVNGSGELYQFAADGTRVRYRDISMSPPGEGGIELSGDGCTAIYTIMGTLVRWNTCTNDDPAVFGPSHGTFSGGLRLLPDGTYLLALFNQRIVHLTSESTVIRTYNIPASAIALDPDGTSFWADAQGSLLRIDIATGTVRSQTFTGAPIFYLSVVGEPRTGLPAHGAEAIPILTHTMLALLVIAIAIVAIKRAF